MLEARVGIEPRHKGFADLLVEKRKISVYAGQRLATAHFVRFLSAPGFRYYESIRFQTAPTFVI
jgi:hypothetical protein